MRNYEDDSSLFDQNVQNVHLGQDQSQYASELDTNNNHQSRKSQKRTKGQQKQNSKVKEQSLKHGLRHVKQQLKMDSSDPESEEKVEHEEIRHKRKKIRLRPADQEYPQQPAVKNRRKLRQSSQSSSDNDQIATKHKNKQFRQTQNKSNKNEIKESNDYVQDYGVPKKSQVINSQKQSGQNINETQSDSSEYYSDQPTKYDNLRRKSKRRIIPSTESSENFNQFSNQFYPNNYQQHANQQRKTQQLFEPQFIKQQSTNNQKSSRSQQPKLRPQSEDDWMLKTTREGFIYFYIKGTNTYQWNFPKYFDPVTKTTRPYFVQNWVKRYDERGKKYFINQDTQMIQHVKPDSETYLIQASILGNIAFLEIYLKHKGTLAISDKQKRNPLHHAVANGHKQFAIILCEFGADEDLIEAEDLQGATPLFTAVRYNEVECLKVLIQYDCNLLHKKKSGDTCMHEAAAYNSLDCMAVLTSFGSYELLTIKNNQRLRPIDVAQKMKNYEGYTAMQKLERNLSYQQAILEREMSPPEKKRQKRNKVVPYQDTMDERKAMKRLKIIQEQSSESSGSQAADQRMNNLGGTKKFKQRLNNMQEQQMMSEQANLRIKKTKDSHKSQRVSKQSDIPEFREYIPSKTQRRPNYKSNKIIPYNDQQQERPSFQQLQKQMHYQNRMKTQNDNTSESDENYSQNIQIAENIPTQQERSYFKLSIRDDNSTMMRRGKTARDMFLMQNSGDSSDDNEKYQYDQEKGMRRRAKSERGNGSKRHRRHNRSVEDRSSLIEKAFDKTTTIVTTIASFVKDKYFKLKDYVWQEQERDDSETSYDTPRSRSKSRSRKIEPIRGQRIQIQKKQQEYYSSSSLDDETPPQNRYNNIIKQKGRRQNNISSDINILKDLSAKSYQIQQNDLSSQGHSFKKSISIQADKIESKIQKQNIGGLTNKRKISTASLHSVGVGSININETFNTQSSQAYSQKQQHSRMIYMEKKRRLGNKSKQLIKKNYQSSEEEVKNERRQVSPSPQPRQSMNNNMNHHIMSPLLRQSQSNGMNDHKAASPMLPRSQNQIEIGKTQPQKMGAPTMLTQEQFDIIMLNEEENKNEGKQTYNNNNQYKNDTSLQEIQKVAKVEINQDAIIKKEPPKKQETRQQVLKQNKLSDSKQTFGPVQQMPQRTVINQDDIQKFYTDLIKNTSITEIIDPKDLPNINGSQSIDESNLSELFKKIMIHKQPIKQTDVEALKLIQDINQIDKKQSDKTEIINEQSVIVFEPDVSPPKLQQSDDYKHYEIQEDASVLQSIMKDFEDYQNISDCSFMKTSVDFQLYNSNILNRGQFVQNSYMSIQDANQNNSIQRPSLKMHQNNSMQQYNVQYQSDYEGGEGSRKFFDKKSQPLLFHQMDSPYRRRVPPLSISKNAQMVSQNHSIKQQDKIIDLFSEDAEYQKQAPFQEEQVVEQVQKEVEINIEDEPQKFCIQMEDSELFQGSIVNNEPIAEPSTDQVVTSPQPKMSNTIILSFDGYKTTKKNNRYDQEDSLINFDLSQTQIQTQHQQQQQQQKTDILPEQVGRYASLGAELGFMRKKSVIQSKQNQSKEEIEETGSCSNRLEVQVEILAMESLPAAYEMGGEIQQWKGQSNKIYGLKDETLQDNTHKRIPRQFLPYHQKRSSNTNHNDASITNSQQNENPLNESENISYKGSQKGMRLKDIEKPLTRKSTDNNNNGRQSIDSIINELDSISRIYNDLETVQEEEVTIERTASILLPPADYEESPDVKKLTGMKLFSKYQPTCTQFNPNNNQDAKASPSIFYQNNNKNILKDDDNNFSENEGPVINRIGAETMKNSSFKKISQQNEDNTSQVMQGEYVWKKTDKQNRSAATPFLYSSSEDESKRKFGGGILARARPKMNSNLYSSSTNAPLYQQKKTVKDVSFKSTNMSNNTDSGDKLRENLAQFQKNKMFTTTPSTRRSFKSNKNEDQKADGGSATTK